MPSYVELESCTYNELVDRRKKCQECAPTLRNPAEINPELDSDRVGPYSRWQGRIGAPVMVVGQDFADVESFRNCRGWPGKHIQTNRTLVDLLKSVGLDIEPPNYGRSDDKLFFTNAVLCMKGQAKPGRQQPVPAKCFDNCRPFLKRTIELVGPRVVVTLGTAALRSVWRAFRPADGCPRLRDAVGKPVRLTDQLQLLPVYHPSPTVQKRHRNRDNMFKDWKPLAKLLADTD